MDLSQYRGHETQFSGVEYLGEFLERQNETVTCGWTDLRVLNEEMIGKKETGLDLDGGAETFRAKDPFKDEYIRSLLHWIRRYLPKGCSLVSFFIDCLDFFLPLVEKLLQLVNTMNAAFKTIMSLNVD